MCDALTEVKLLGLFRKHDDETRETQPKKSGWKERKKDWEEKWSRTGYTFNTRVTVHHITVTIATTAEGKQPDSNSVQLKRLYHPAASQRCRIETVLCVYSTGQPFAPHQ